VNKDWLNEVLENFEPKQPKDHDGNVFWKDKVRDQAHKLISAQLIRERQTELMKLIEQPDMPRLLTREGYLFHQKLVQALTNQLKELEDV